MHRTTKAIKQHICAAGTALALLLLAGIAVLSGPAQAAEKRTGDYFPLGPGFFWKYKIAEINEDVTVKVTEKKKVGTYDSFRVETTRQSSPTPTVVFFSKTPDKILMVGCELPQDKQMKVFPAPMEYLRVPLSVGKSWTWTEKVMDNSGKTYTQTMKVIKSEIISVPAGMFPCIHILHEYTQDGTPMKKHLWYAASVGLVKWTVEDGKTKVTVLLTEYKAKM